jgi:hypothetical protein
MIKKTKKDSHKKRLGLGLLMFIITGVFIVISVFYSINISSFGEKLLVLENEQQELIKRNFQLGTKLANSTSLRSVEDKAGGLGYKKPDNLIYIKAEEFVAKAP